MPIDDNIPARLNHLASWGHKKIDDGVDQYEGILRKVLDKIEIIAMDAPSPNRCIPPPLVNAQEQMENIAEAVSSRTGVAVKTLCSRLHTGTVVEARRVAVYITRQVTRLSLREIGKYFGGRDHSTVLVSCRGVSRDMKADPRFRKRVQEMVKAASVD